MVSYVINPKTNRKIKVGGPTYNILKKAKSQKSLSATLKSYPKTRKYRRARLESQVKRSGEGRGSKTRGWAAAAPQRGRKRQELMSKCGRSCFLKPENLGYPICGALRTSKGCQVDCRGITSTLIRARQNNREPSIAKTALSLQKKYKC